MSRYPHSALQSLTIPANNTVQNDMDHSNQAHWAENTAIQQLVMLNAIIACITTSELEICKSTRSFTMYIIGTAFYRRT